MTHEKLGLTHRLEISKGASYASKARPVHSHVASWCFAPLAFSMLFYAFILAISDRLSPDFVDIRMLQKRNILWLIAHPDDEAMFFAPSILGILSENRRVEGFGRPEGYVLSVSLGNSEGLGSIRRAELRASCLVLGVQPNHCLALDFSELQDNPDEWWPEPRIEELVRVYAEKWKIDAIVTFDHDGVSGHSNHRALFSSLLRAVHSSTPFPCTYVLSTSGVLEKYSSILTLPWTFMKRALGTRDIIRPMRPDADGNHVLWSPSTNRSSIFISSPHQYRQARLAFSQHRTQFRWFRYLYILSSRYMWYNELHEIL